MGAHTPDNPWADLPEQQAHALTLLAGRCSASAQAGPDKQVLQQLHEAARQFRTLAAALQRQQQLTGVDPLTPEARHQAALDQGVIEPDAVAAADEPPATPEKTSLSPEAERLLQSVFAVADALDKAQVTGLAHIARCSEHQVRGYFSRLRSNVRSIVQRAQKHAEKASTADPLPPPAAAAGLGSEQAGKGAASMPPPLPPASAQLPAHQQQQVSGAGVVLQGRALTLYQQQQASMERTQRLLDASAAVSMAMGGSFVTFMQQTSSYVVRGRQLSAMAASGTATLLRMISSKLLDELERWLVEGLRDQQLSFVRQVLQVLQRLPISLPLLQSSTIQRTVADLEARGPVRACAHHVGSKWRALQAQATSDSSQLLLLGSHGSGGSGKAGKGGAGARGAAGAGHGLPLQRSMSTAVKRKALELKASSAAAAAAAGGAGAAGVSAAAAPQQQQQQEKAAAGNAAAGAAAAGNAAAAAAPKAAAAGFKRPSKVVKVAAGAGPSAAAQRAAQVQRNLTAAHKSSVPGAAGAGSGAAGAAESLRVKSPADLTPLQRLYGMQRKALDQQQLKALGVSDPHIARQLSAAVDAYNRGIQTWLEARCRRVGAEARAHLQYQQQRVQQQQQVLMVGGDAAAGAVPWVQPPTAVWSADLQEQCAAGEESKDAAAQQQAAAAAGAEYTSLPADVSSPQEPAAAAADRDTSSSPTETVSVPWWPEDDASQIQQACRMWSAGIRCPDSYKVLPSADQVAAYEAQRAAAAAGAAAAAAAAAQQAVPEQVHPQYNTGAQYVAGGWGIAEQQQQQQGMPPPLMLQQQQMPQPAQPQQAPGVVLMQHVMPLPPGMHVTVQQPMQPQMMQVVYPQGYVQQHPAPPAGYVQYAPQPGHEQYQHMHQYQYPPGYQ